MITRMKLPKTLEGQAELWLWLSALPAGALLFYSPQAALSFGIGAYTFTFFFRQIRLQVQKVFVDEGCGAAEGKASLIGGFLLRYALLGIFLVVVLVTKVVSIAWVLAGLSFCVAFLLSWSALYFYREKNTVRGDG
ncbi:ATP synthase I [Desulfurispirillum indicum S5]|uniref:ATP synthase I n=2 Tax=Desulfurispirillum TaxID=393029 RepID=E6W1W7_DESIS|nr:ATP synthase subunit I [Desulfurispirillum indicum]ADU65499.1 ATP synthase I [Desulfurispirillum indicum S5]